MKNTVIVRRPITRNDNDCRCNKCGGTIFSDDIVYKAKGMDLCMNCLSEITRKAEQNARMENEEILQKEDYADPIIEAIERIHAEPPRIMSIQEIYDALSEHIIGQERAKREIARAIYQHMVRLGCSDEECKMLPKSSMIMVGPSGSGKTEFVRAISEILDIPVAMCDATTLTPAGYRGADVESLINILYHNAGRDIKKAERGIVFIDEFDKIACRYEDLNAHKMMIQQSLLKLIEGKIADVPTSSGGVKESVRINTENILFIVGGAFVGLRNQVEKKVTNSIGFISTHSEEEPCKYEELTSQDIIDYGIIPELVGRLPIIVELNKLTETDMVRILTEPKYALTKKYQHLFEKLGKKLVFTDGAILYIAQKAMHNVTGVRALTAVVEHYIGKYICNIPENESECIITRNKLEEFDRESFD